MTERFTITDCQEWVDYFNLYRDFILPRVYGHVLDLGCGEGWLTKLIALQEDVLGVDAYDKFHDQPEENKDVRIDYKEVDLTNFTIDGKYDVITSTEFIEHIEKKDLEKLLEEVKKSGTRFIGCTPNKIVPTTNIFHLQEYTIGELKALFLAHGLEGSFTLLREDLTAWDVK